MAWLAVGVYTTVITGALALQNRSPQSTFAWGALVRPVSARRVATQMAVELEIGLRTVSLSQ
jgi:hypothetical protein